MAGAATFFTNIVSGWDDYSLSFDPNWKSATRKALLILLTVLLDRQQPTLLAWTAPP